uniref:hypothetical protein n=1 Tax=Salmonella enterica TaxID=28901 RepID=UPI003299EFF9
ANTSITIKCGASKITMTPAGITIDSPNVTVKGQAAAKVTSPMTSVEGSGFNKITGGVVLIN